MVTVEPQLIAKWIRNEIDSLDNQTRTSVKSVFFYWDSWKFPTIMEPGTTGMDSTTSQEAAPSNGQQRAFSQLASYRNRNGNTVSPAKSDASSTKSIVQNTNGTSTTLQYPIVTQPGSRRRGFGMPSFWDTLTRTRDFLGLTDSHGRDHETLWTERRIRLAARRYGGVDSEAVARTLPRCATIVTSGETLCCDNRRLIGTPLIVIARQSQKNRD